jgi:zinc protease
MRRTLLACVAVAALAGPALAQAPAPTWAQAGSDIAPDPAVRFGVLPNGMRYAIMKNATPAGQTSIRLRIGSGSLEENDDQQGLAHVLEHMAFQGSTRVPRGEMIKILERNGLAFGPDTNAQTGWTQTVYMLDLPKSDPALLDTGLMLMRETASELLIDPKALETERGVVLSEERLRDTPEYRALKAQINLLAHGQRITERYPIGLVPVVKGAPASLVRDFYRANYRPERATLVVVGDFDPAEVEAKIKAEFAAWAPVGPPTAEPDLGQVEKRGLTVSLVDVPGAQTLTYIAWARPYDASPDTKTKRRREVVENLALAVLNRRLGRLATAPNPPFLAADASFENLLHSAKVAVIEGASAPGAWRPALTTIEQEVRRLTTFGVSQAEIDQETAQSRAQLVNAVAGVHTRPTPELASGLADSTDENLVFTEPATDLALYDEAVKDVTPEEVDAAAKRIFAGAGPLVELETPTPVDGGEKTVADAFAASAAIPVIAPVAEKAIVWPYRSFGPAGAVKTQTQIADLGATVVRFANGVALTVKPTDFRKDQVLVTVAIGHGREGLPADRAAPLWAAPAFIEGGFEALSHEDSERALAGRIYGAQLGVTDSAFQLQGATRPADLSTQMQVLAAYVAHPGYRTEAFERFRQGWLTALPQLAATPEGVLGRDLEQQLHAGDRRWETPNEADLKAAKPDDLKALLAGPLSTEPVEITIVGDVTVEEAIKQTAATFGALPARPAPDLKAGTAAVFPAPSASPIVESDGGRADQAVAVAAWPVTDFYQNMHEARADILAGEVLENRLIDRVRNAEGATYSPSVSVALSETFRRYGRSLAFVEMPPQKLPGFYADLAELTADMRDKGITADELERARNPHVASIKKAMLTNEYWLQRLEGSVADPRRLELIRTTLPDYDSLTAADVQMAAARDFDAAKTWKLEVKAPGAP